MKSKVRLKRCLPNNPRLLQAFIIADLSPDELRMDELPIHRAIQVGRSDLVNEVIKAAGSVQAVGSILAPGNH